MIKLYKLLGLLWVLLPAFAWADTFYEVKSNFATPCVKDIHYNEDDEVITFHDDFSSSTFSFLNKDSKLRYYLHFYFRNSKTGFCETGFSYVDYVYCSDGNFKGNSLNVDCNAYLGKDFNDKTFVYDNNKIYKNDGGLRSFNISNILELCKKKGVYDLRVFIETEYEASGYDDVYAPISAKQGLYDLWKINYVDISISPVTYSFEATTIDANNVSASAGSGSCLGATNINILPGCKANLNITVDGTAALVYASTYDVSSGNAILLSGNALLNVANNKNGKTQYSYSKQFASSDVSPQHKIYVKFNIRYKDIKGVVMEQTFTTGNFIFRNTQIVNIKKGTTYSVDGTKYVTAANDLVDYLQAGSKVYFQHPDPRCEAIDAITYDMNPVPTISRSGNVSAITLTRGSLTLHGVKTVSVSTRCSFAQEPYWNTEALAGSEVVLQDPLPAPLSMTFRGCSANASKNSSGKYVITPYKDETVVYDYFYELGDGSLADVLNAKPTVARMSFGGLTGLTGGIGHIGAPFTLVGQDAQPAGSVKFIDGTLVAPLSLLPEPKPMAAESIVANDLEVGLKANVLQVSVNQECELAVYNLSGVCSLAAIVSGNVSIPLQIKGVCIVVIRRAGAVVYANKFNVK